MLHDQQATFRQAVALGPDHCPPDLLAGSVQAIVSGLKVHSATVARARHSALESTFPRTRLLLGAEAFFDTCCAYLADDRVLRLSPNLIGARFADTLEGEAKFLANIEWAWLESYGAKDGRTLAASDVAAMEPRAVIGCRVGLHPAARLVVAQERVLTRFDGLVVATAAVLVTRPEMDVQVRETTAGMRRFCDFIGSGRPLGMLLERDFELTAFLLTNGALMRAMGDPR